MATVHVTIGAVGVNNGYGSVIHVYNGHDIRSETITSSGTTAAGSLTARKGQVAKISCETAVYANCGATPTASATTGVYIEGGAPAYIMMQEGDVIAVIDA